MNETMLALLGFVTIITVPAMLPVYKKLKIRPTTLLLICVTSMGVMNLLPWSGPTMRAATVLGIEPNQLWLQILPMQVVGIIIALATAVFWGIVEKKRGAGAVTDVEITAGGNVEEQTEAREYARPKLFWFNLILTLTVIVCLIFVKVPSYQNTIHIKFLRKNPSWCCRKMRSTQRDFSICSKTTESKIVPWSIH